MLKNCNVTVFIRTGSKFDVCRFENAFVYEEKKINAEGGGRVCSDRAVSRVFTTDKIPVRCGDLIIFSLTDSDNPPPDCYTVTAVCDNRKSTQSHYRITAEK